MKTLYYSLLCGAALAMSACSSNELEQRPVDGNQKVTISVNLPGQFASRAFGDGTTAQDLHYAVMDATTGVVVDNGNIKFGAAAEATPSYAQVNLVLAKGRGYELAFFACNDAQSIYTFDVATKSVKIDYSKITDNNATDYDAFYAKYSIAKVTGAISQNITLTRPLAQINWGSSDLSEGAVKDLYSVQTMVDMGGVMMPQKSVVIKSSVSISGVYSSFDMFTGALTGEASTVTLPMSERPGNEYMEYETFPVDGYKYLNCSYALVPATTSLVDMTLTPGNGVRTMTPIAISNVPVQANYRTNIYGAILTRPVDVTVEIKPQADGSSNHPAN